MKPIKFDEWYKDHRPDKVNVWTDAYLDQIFSIDLIARTLEVEPDVISTHLSKSIVLPVYRISFNEATAICRDNFYGWNVAVQARVKLFGLSDIMEGKEYCFCEGMEDYKDLPAYTEGCMQFVSDCNHYQLYALLRHLKNLDRK